MTSSQYDSRAMPQLVGQTRYIFSTSAWHSPAAARAGQSDCLFWHQVFFFPASTQNSCTS